jgi:hypothetical protein
MFDRPEFAHRATKKIVACIIGFFIFVPLLLFVFGEIVRSLWNWLMPALFHFGAITFWQAIGLMVLSWILFGGLRGVGRVGSRRGGDWGPRGRWNARWEERWERRWQQMSPEEQTRFREWARTRCGPFSSPNPASQP